MHLGNLFAALYSWLDVKSQGGRWLLRHEDLDPQRSHREYATLIEDDLLWLGLQWDGEPQYQSRRHNLYAAELQRLTSTGMVYPCRCRRRDILATQAPHQTDGRVIYSGKCRPVHMPCHNVAHTDDASLRLYVPDNDIIFTDGVFGQQSVNLARECGDFIVRRADGAWAYQLAVVADDADMGVTHVVRGSDLLLSAAQQLHLYNLLGHQPPQFIHIPLLCNAQGQRLSKRDQAMDCGALRQRFSPQELIGLLAYYGGQADTPAPMTLIRLLQSYQRCRIPNILQMMVN